MLSNLALSAAALLALTGPVWAQATSDPDWPCIQRLVPELTAAQMWSGPPLEAIDADWQSDRDIAPLVLKLVDPDIETVAAQELIEGFAQTLEPAARSERLPLLFKATLEMVNGERRDMIRLIKRYAARQRALAERIAADNAALQGVRLDTEPDERQRELMAIRERRDWDLRIFDDRFDMLTLVCEQPVLLEQRAFALARVIQEKLP